MHAHPTITTNIAAQHVAELQREAAKQRLVRQIRAAQAGSSRSDGVQHGWARLHWHRTRPAAA